MGNLHTSFFGPRRCTLDGVFVGAVRSCVWLSCVVQSAGSVRNWRCWFFLASSVLASVVSLVGCERSVRSPFVSSRSSESVSVETVRSASGLGGEASGELDLIPLLRDGTIDAAGPVVDLGEPQAAAFLLPPLPRESEIVNGDSWALVGPRLRLRVPVSLASPPTVVRFRVRRAHARGVMVLIDGVPARTALLPTGAGPVVVSLPVFSDRFRRDVTELELRFYGVTRSTSSDVSHGGGDAGAIARRSAVSLPVAAIDWVHLARDGTPAVRTSDLVADVRAGGPPRRALTIYSPTVLSTTTVIPARATLRAALSAEGIHGSRPGSVRASIRVEADDKPSVDFRAEMTAGASWREVSLDLSSLAGKAARITVAAEGGGDTRLAIADPRIVVTRNDASVLSLPPVRHVLMVVVRGARMDRFLPVLSPRLNAGGFAKLMREGIVAAALAPSPRALAALASAVTGLPADVHGMAEWTDTLDEEAPTVAALLREAGVATAGFSDDRWWQGSGLDRGLSEQGGCPGEVVWCRAETVLAQAVEWLVRQRQNRSFALVVTRAGIPPFDPPPDLLNALDPEPYEGAITAEQSARLWARSRRGAVHLDRREMDRLAALYDAALAGVDRGLAAALDRLRDTGMLTDTAVIVVGDRGTPLGELGFVGEGPMSLTAVSHTVLMVKNPGVAPARLGETVSVLDAAATVLECLGAASEGRGPSARAGAVSLLTLHGARLHARGVVTVVSARGDLGLRFGELLALERGTGGMVLLQPEMDPLGRNDLSSQWPIARSYAESVLASYRQAGADEIVRRVYVPSTRALPPAVESALRSAGLLWR